MWHFRECHNGRGTPGRDAVPAWKVAWQCKSYYVTPTGEGEDKGAASNHAQIQVPRERLEIFVAVEKIVAVLDATRFVFVKAKRAAEPADTVYAHRRDSKTNVMDLSIVPDVRPADGQMELSLAFTATACPEIPGKRLVVYE